MDEYKSSSEDSTGVFPKRLNHSRTPLILCVDNRKAEPG